jgi:hypothetical protein
MVLSMRALRRTRKNWLPGTLARRGVLDKSHISQASSARRFVIEATYSL